MAEILVVGAGPVGLTLACELARHGIRCRMIDKLAMPIPYCRAIGVTPRTLEVWEDMGLAREMIDRGLWIEGMRSIVHGFPTHDELHELSDIPYAQLALPQNETELVLTNQLNRFGIEVERGVALTTLAQDERGVTVGLQRDNGTGEEARYQYVIGCDGAHSAVRHLLGIAYEGDSFPMPFMLGDVHIEWDLPRGMALRALRLVAESAPDMFIAIPLPEPGRYRVSMLAPPELAPKGVADHGIQAELAGPDLARLQAIADDLVPVAPRLSDLRWSSIFRISMRLAAKFRVGRCFIAGDAAHIHPPTGGQGMNTGIQDAYNLAWKLALVTRRLAPPTLLESYDAERRPVGADVIARTVAASERFGRDDRKPSDRLADTQLRMNYRDTGWVCDQGGGSTSDEPNALRGGDRAPDCNGLRRQGVGYPLRMFDLLRGTRHVLLVDLTNRDAIAADGELDRLGRFACDLTAARGDVFQVVAVVSSLIVELPDAYRVTVVRDDAGEFSAMYGDRCRAWLVRPDGYVAWCAPTWEDLGFSDYLNTVCR